MLLINIISPNKLKEGGAAILEEHKRNHQRDILGIILIRPLFKNKLRLPKRSYVILARQNNPDEHKP